MLRLCNISFFEVIRLFSISVHVQIWIRACTNIKSLIKSGYKDQETNRPEVSKGEHEKHALYNDLEKMLNTIT